MIRLQSALYLIFALTFLMGASFLIGACNERKGGTLEDILREPIEVKVNPYDRVPLGALLSFEAKKPVQIETILKGRQSVSKTFDPMLRTHSIPVLGLYADTSNIVEIILTDKDNRKYKGEVSIQTGALPDFFPEMKVDKMDRARMEPGMHLAELLLANDGFFHSYTILFDDDGEVRWYMDMSEAGKIAYSPLRLSNGNWFYLSWIDLYEVSPLGKLVRKDQMWGFAGDHDIVEMPNGHLLMGGSKKDAVVLRADGNQVATRYDYVVEWDRTSTGRAVHEWDLAGVLDIDRSVFPEDYSLDAKADWFHINSIVTSPTDDALIASGRNQGVTKVSKDGQPIWILAPHLDWGRMGRKGTGEETSKYLLTAIDAQGRAYPEKVQMGLAKGDGFEWPTGQHALTLLDTGHLLMFDNGLSRDFKNKPSYSRAVEYKIDESKMTVQQVWEYGKERGLGMFSGITSDVDVLPITKNRLITAGNVRLSSLPPHGKMVELTYPDNEVVFEANIFFKDAKGSGEKSWAQFDLVYRGERYDLYQK